MTERNIEIAARSLNPGLRLVVHSKFQVLLRAIWLAVAIGVTLLLLSGCTAQAISKMEDQLAARKAESLKGWETVTLDGRPVLKVLGLRTAWFFVTMIPYLQGTMSRDSGSSGQGQGQRVREWPPPRRFPKMAIS